MRIPLLSPVHVIALATVILSSLVALTDATLFFNLSERHCYHAAVRSSGVIATAVSSISKTYLALYMLHYICLITDL